MAPVTGFTSMLMGLVALCIASAVFGFCVSAGNAMWNAISKKERSGMTFDYPEGWAVGAWLTGLGAVAMAVYLRRVLRRLESRK